MNVVNFGLSLPTILEYLTSRNHTQQYKNIYKLGYKINIFIHDIFLETDKGPEYQIVEKHPTGQSYPPEILTILQEHPDALITVTITDNGPKYEVKNIKHVKNRQMKVSG